MSLLISFIKFYSQFQAASPVLALARTSRPLVASFSQGHLSFARWLRPVEETTEEDLIVENAYDHNTEEWAGEEEGNPEEEEVPAEEEEKNYDEVGHILD